MTNPFFKTNLVTTLTLSAVLASQPVLAASPSFATLNTTGFGRINVTPDMATFSIAIDQTKPSAEEAKKSIDTVVSTLLERLQEGGLKRADIQSSTLRISPHYKYNKKGDSTLLGYQGVRNITVTVNDLTQLDTYLTISLEAGINRVDNIQLNVKEKEKYQALARTAAIEDAQAKAQSVAEQFGNKLAGVWEIHYNSNNAQPIMARAMSMDMSTKKVDTGYQDKSIKFNDQVNVIYRIERH